MNKETSCNEGQGFDVEMIARVKYPFGPATTIGARQYNSTQIAKRHAFADGVEYQKYISAKLLEENNQLKESNRELLIALKDARATLIRWQECAHMQWDERDDETMEIIEAAINKASL